MSGEWPPSDVTWHIPASEWLTFGGCGISINGRTGEVKIPDGLALDDAARAFWEAVRGMFPGTARDCDLAIVLIILAASVT